MFLKLIVAVACSLFLIGLSTRVVTYNKGSQNVSEWKEKHSLKARAKRAAAEGKRKVVSLGPIENYAGRNIDLDTALKIYSVVIAQPVENGSYAVDTDNIDTWYKFRLLETLSARPAFLCDTCPPAREIRQEAEPLRADEFVIITSGGTVNVDGVEITLQNHALPPFVMGQKYLLFVSFNPARVTTLGGGPAGVFVVKEDGQLQPIDGKARRSTEIDRRFARKLSRFESHVKS